LDARDIKMEDENKTIERMKKIDKAVSGGEFYISTSASLEFLPPKEAFDKLLLLGKLKETFNKGA
jgi:methionine synthase II (cobalamin-independent)